jgi:hypothetical protein
MITVVEFKTKQASESKNTPLFRFDLFLLKSFLGLRQKSFKNFIGFLVQNVLSKITDL